MVQIDGLRALRNYVDTPCKEWPSGTSWPERREVRLRFSEWLDLVPADRAVAVLMRHAERSPIESVRDSLQARLTDRGIKDAELLGRRLSGFPRIELRHSPVERCRQTAQAIATGCTDAGGNASVFGSDTILGGPYMLDWRRAMALVMERGAGWFVERWFSGQLEPGLVIDAHEAACQQLENLAARLQEAHAPRLVINVSHDWNLLLVRYFYLERTSRMFGWPEYLEAVALYERDGGLYLRRGELERRIEALPN